MVIRLIARLHLDNRLGVILIHPRTINPGSIRARHTLSQRFIGHSCHLQSDQTFQDSSNKSSSLPFDHRKNHEAFGQVVKKDRSQPQDATNERVNDEEMSPYRNQDGTFIKGDTAEEARLHDKTLQGRMNHKVLSLPEEISKTINNNILRMATPSRLRAKAAQIYQAINKEQLQTAPTTSLEADAHIAALFLQDYAHSYQVLDELQRRVITSGEEFNPKDILTVGYGPATGMVALNELMGDEFNPNTKDAYIVGRANKEMKKRAKIILSRQMNEQVEQETTEQEATEQEAEQQLEEMKEAEFDESDEFDESEDVDEEYLGPVDTSKITIRTKLKDSLPTNKMYDLIIVNQALLTKEYNFPRDVDTNIHMLLKLLKPEGHIVLVERGNSLGFESIARARQLMIRPESYEKEAGKIPRPYIKGSSIKPQKLRHEDQIITEDHIKYEEELLQQLEKEEQEQEQEQGQGQVEISEFERSIIETHGQVSEDDLKFEFENDKNFETNSVNESTNPDDSPDHSSQLGSESVNYHLQIISPCPHHSKCPLQLGDPKYYKIPSHKHRLNFCSFDKVVERPKYTMELKKGKKLSTTWDKSSDDGFGLDKLTRNTLKRLSGSGRPGGNNTENGSYSYLIAKRSANSIESINQIEHDREYNNSIKVNNSNPMNWPRIIDMPTRIKNNVKLTSCAPSGNIEIWQIPKSLGKQEYHDARKAERGDLWGLGKKSVIVKNQLSDKVKNKLDILSKTQRKTFLKEQRKKVWKKLVSQSEEEFDNDIVKLSDSIATNLEASKQYKLKGKRAKFDIDPREYEGR